MEGSEHPHPFSHRGHHRGHHRGGRGHHGHHGHRGGHHGGPPGPGPHGFGGFGGFGGHCKPHGPGGHHKFGHGGHHGHHGRGGKGHWGPPPNHEMWGFQQETMEYAKPQEGVEQVNVVVQEPIKQQQHQHVITQQVDTGNNDKNVDEQLLCGICCLEKKNHFFEPCMHLYACEACAKQIFEVNKKCPICTNSISGIRKIFIA